MTRPRARVHASRDRIRSASATPSSDVLVEVSARKLARAPVCPEQPVPVHEEVAVVEHEQPVVNMVVGCCAEAHHAEEAIPRVRILRMNQHKPVGVERAKCHVGPDVGRHHAGDNHERDYNHERGVRQRAVERVEEARVGEAVVRLVGVPVHPARYLVLAKVHEVLQRVLQQQLGRDVLPADPAREGVVGRRHPPQHPGTDEVAADESEAFGLGQVRLQALAELVRPLLRLHAPRAAQPPGAAQGVVAEHEDVAHGNRQQTQGQAQRLHCGRVRHAVGASSRRHGRFVVPCRREDRFEVGPAQR
mmetsp:Transcript_32724/g.101967  ORF Transcript_32724/g.101967 Transcript_32724/m.101967 type:complete len:304 (+) Transcript_32724:3-914(+)